MNHHDYPTKPIGRGNPYHCCKFCGRSTPSINGELEGHSVECPYRLEKTAGTWVYRETYYPEPEES